jgi:3-oxosteroid 1-dehydrogenase
MVLERLVQDPAGVRGSFMIPGDSMLIVNRFGRRVVSEKLPYHDFARVFFEWDGHLGTYPNNPLIAVWDDAAARFGGDGFGNPIPRPAATTTGWSPPTACLTWRRASPPGSRGCGP